MSIRYTKAINKYNENKHDCQHRAIHGRKIGGTIVCNEMKIALLEMNLCIEPLLVEKQQIKNTSLNIVHHVNRIRSKRSKNERQYTEDMRKR
ncbi:unnamed protein product [Cunninghamella echinulata]